ncbi:MAG: C13 family peptidase, partial [Candidatus Bathyarchaeia archaeon]
PNPATIYAIKQGLPGILLSKINPLGYDGNLSEWEKYIIDHFTELPPIYIDWIMEKATKRKTLTKWEEYIVNNVDRLPACFIEEILSDKQISYEEFMQSRFLGRFDKGYVEKEKNEKWINNPDLDNDGFTNEFEVSFLFTDPYTYNGRFAILACSKGLPPSWKEQVKFVEEFLRTNGFKEENIYGLYDEEMTFQNFEQIINIVAAKSNEDDLILVLLAGHGRKNEISFSEGWINYESIRNALIKLKARTQILIIDACYSGTAIPFLKSENRVVIASSREDEETYRGTLFYIFSAMTDKSCDLNNDNYCSLLEAFYGAKTMIESKFENHPQISDETLAEKIYLVEFYLEKIYT